MSASPSDVPTVKLYAIQDKLNAFIKEHLGYAAVDIERDGEVLKIDSLNRETIANQSR